MYFLIRSSIIKYRYQIARILSGCAIGKALAARKGNVFNSIRLFVRPHTVDGPQEQKEFFIFTKKRNYFMHKPILVIMAAGMGSRYGGLKQIDPVGPNGQIILDYSVYDAHRAGFEEVVFIIRPELEETFEDAIGRKARRFMRVQYAYQTLDRLPAGLSAPAGREKPLGTAHAVYCARELVADAPIAVINADDFYGADAFRKVYAYLAAAKDDDKYRYCMVGYRVENTLTENGTVSRGVCTGDENGLLTSIIERTAIRRDTDGVIRYAADGTAPAGEIADGTPVSMNLWGFTPSFLPALDEGLRHFFAETLPKNPMKGEYYLPFAVDELIEAGRATARLLTTDAQWFGVTYREDKPVVCAAIAEMTARGEYPAD